MVILDRFVSHGVKLQATLQMAVTVDAVAVVWIFVECLATELTVHAVRVIAAVSAVAAMPGHLEQFLVKVALVRLAAAVTRCIHSHISVTRASLSCTYITIVITIITDRNL